MGICRSLCHSYNFVNMRFVVKDKCFPIKCNRKIYFHGKFITEFYYFFFFSYMFLRMNKFLFTEIPCLMKQGSYSCCIFQSVYALNTCSIKNLPKECRQTINYAIIKQQFYAAH